MTQHHSGLLHFHLRKRLAKQPPKDRVKLLVDKIVYVIAFVNPIMNLPQLLKIWINQDAAGISLVSWCSFALFSIIWFFYGVVHKEKPIIIMNASLFVVQVGIIIGTLLHM